MNKTKLKLIIASVYATILNAIFVTVITVWAELSLPLKDWLKGFTGHNWTTKSIFSVLFFVLFTIIFFFILPARENNLRWALRCLIVVTILGVLALTLFFTVHHFTIW